MQPSYHFDFPGGTAPQGGVGEERKEKEGRGDKRYPGQAHPGQDCPAQEYRVR